jgi:hypothetical protein
MTFGWVGKHTVGVVKLTLVGVVMKCLHAYMVLWNVINIAHAGEYSIPLWRDAALPADEYYLDFAALVIIK